MPSKRSSDRTIDPIVKGYLKTDLPLTEIIEKITDQRTPLSHALLYIEECLEGRRLAKDAIAAAMAVPMKGADPELLILMLSGWAELSCRITGPSEAAVLIHKAQGLISKKTHPEIRARSLFAESALSSVRGNEHAREQILKGIIEILPPRSSRRKFYLLELVMFLARQGRGLEFQDLMKELKRRTNTQLQKASLLMAEFINAMETGKIDEASLISNRIATQDQESHVLSDPVYLTYEALLRILSPEHEHLASHKGRRRVRNVPSWIAVLQCLLARDTEQALEHARLEANKGLDILLGTGYQSFSLIRSELSDGNWHAARRLLEIHHSRGNTHYLDSLFFARAELLANHKRKASAFFAEALEAAERYDARERFDLELRASCELSRGDIVELSRPLEPAQRKRPATVAEPVTAIGDEPYRVDEIIGKSSKIAGIRRTILKLADSTAPVLITGETGTGKELAARALHEASKRKGKPFVAINCSAIAESLLESELFGHKRGAFTGAERENKGLFEAAGEGTILLDEIGEIMPRLQRALLRVLETREIRAVGSSASRKIKCRVIAATNADIGKLSTDGLFRQDLIYRLQRLVLHIPPLRERKDDILLLARHFLDIGRTPDMHASMSQEMIEAMKAYEWPGNVRELKNVIERMRLMHSDKLTYGTQDLDLKFHTGKSPASDDKELTKYPSDTTALPYTDQSPAISSMPQAHRHFRHQIRRLDHLRELFRQYGKMTRSEIVAIMDVSPNTATKDLRALIDEGLITRIEPSASTRSHYFALAQK
jgi:DNA-binding NtrC family response regulator